MLLRIEFRKTSRRIKTGIEVLILQCDFCGVQSSLQLSSCRENCNTPEANTKKFETRKENGNFGGKSAPEDLLYARYVAQFGADDVERHVWVNGWDIDMHIKSIDVYVQHDGSYYHGLDRHIEVIKESKRQLTNPFMERGYETMHN